MELIIVFVFGLMSVAIGAIIFAFGDDMGFIFMFSFVLMFIAALGSAILAFYIHCMKDRLERNNNASM